MPNHYRSLALGALALVGPTALAQKPATPTGLELGRDVVLESALVTPGVTSGFVSRGADGGSDTPEAAALAFLASATSVGSAEELVHRVTTSGPAGRAVRFTHTVGGVPVLGAETVVSVDAGGRVRSALLGLQAELSLARTTPAVAPEAARQAAHTHLGVTGALELDETRLVVVPQEVGARLAWQVRVIAEAPRGDWEALVDALTGELFRVADRTLYHRGERERPSEGPAPAAPMAPTVEGELALAGRQMLVTAQAMVFLPDPLTRANATYGQTGYVDNGDNDSAQLTAARTQVSMEVTQNGANYELRGPWTRIVEIEAPNRGLFAQSSPAWNFTRSNNAFDAANTYYHIDRMMRYVNDTLGVPVRPHQAVRNGLVEFDAHGENGADNSHYSNGQLVFGEGCVDDNEDADVIIHELGHGLHDWLTVGGLSQVNGLSEGTGDYLAVSYSRRLGLLTPADPEYNWVFKWDGHNSGSSVPQAERCWPGRVTNVTATYPGGLVNQVHSDGQIWSTVNLQIWDDIGAERMDLAMLEGLRLTNSSTNQQQAAQKVMEAAQSMGFSQAELNAMYTRYIARGYNVTQLLAVAAEGDVHAGSGRLGLTLGGPNPFRDRTTLVLRAGGAEQVTVGLYDVLGRRVRTLFEGTLGAGEVRSLAVDAAGLPAGLYVVRAAGERGVAVQTVVVAR